MKALFFICFLLAAGTAPAADGQVQIAGVEPGVRPGEARVIPPAVDEKYEYYEVTGCDAEALRSQLCRNGCRWKDGRVYDSVTSWHVKWDYGYEKAPQSCRADAFRAVVDITYRYPRWVNTGDAPLQLVEKWNTYMERLVAHEQLHRDMAVDTAAQLTHAVSALAPAATCDDIDREVRSLSRHWMKQLNADAKLYDEATHHGAKQGAVFP